MSLIEVSSKEELEPDEKDLELNEE